MKTYTLQVSGAHCASCKILIEDILNHQDIVKKARVDLKKEMTITNKWIASKCGYTPFDGMKVTGWPTHTILGGQVVMQDDRIILPHTGRPIDFIR